MISRSRSAPRVAAISIECTTSANSTVTCLYSADRVAFVTRAPHSPQNLASGCGCGPQDPQGSPVVVNPPPPSPLGSTSVSFHCWSTMSAISPWPPPTRSFATLICIYFETDTDRASARQRFGRWATTECARCPVLSGDRPNTDKHPIWPSAHLGAALHRRFFDDPPR